MSWSSLRPRPRLSSPTGSRKPRRSPARPPDPDRPTESGGPTPPGRRSLLFLVQCRKRKVNFFLMSQERLIKKYANRRLYDASQSRHITLDDIRALIVKGEKIKVVEDKTGHDITRHILLQVIAEQEQFGRPILSTPVLESIIRFYEIGRASCRE